MLKKHRIAKLFASATAVIVLSCQNPKAASKANFRTAIQAALDKRPECLLVSMPNSEPDFQGRSRTNPQSEALVSAGLAYKQHGMVSLPALFSFGGGPKRVPGIRYDFTPEGRKYIGHPAHVVFSADDSPTQAICYGMPEVLDIVRYSEPGAAMGQTVTEVTYTYAITRVPPWTKSGDMQQQFPQLAHIQTREHPGEAQIELVLMSDGWRVPNAMF